MPKKDDNMARVVDVIGDYKIIRTSKDYIVINTKGEHRHHSHVKKESTARLLIKLVTRKTMPRSDYLVEAARRITLDDKYRYELELKQNKDKQRYINVNTGIRR